MFSPIFAAACVTRSATVRELSLMYGCESKTSSLSLFAILPSTIFSLICSGFPDLSGKPEQIKEQIVEGRIAKRLNELVLL